MCRGKLAGYKVPRRVLVVDAISHSPNGETDYTWAELFASVVLSGAN